MEACFFKYNEYSKQDLNSIIDRILVRIAIKVAFK